MSPDEMRAQRQLLDDIMIAIDRVERMVDDLGDSEETMRCLLQAKVHLLKKRRILDKQMFELE